MARNPDCFNSSMNSFFSTVSSEAFLLADEPFLNDLLGPAAATGVLVAAESGVLFCVGCRNWLLAPGIEAFEVRTAEAASSIKSFS